jgi:sirohydrochlorin ferrochelatase
VRPARLSTTDGSADGPPPLVLVAHGSRDPAAAATAEDLAGLVRERAPGSGLDGLTVRVAYLGHAAPAPGQVLDTLPGGPVVVLPLLLTDAYHSKTDIPAVLRAATARGCGAREIRYGEPLGPHPLLLRVLERRLAQAGVPAGDPDTSVVLAAAGTSDPAARAAIREVAAGWQRRRGWREVVTAYCASLAGETPDGSAAAPTPGAAVSALRARAAGGRVVVASYLLAPGRFATQVAAESLTAGADAVGGVLGAAPELADIVLARYGAERTPAARIA